MSSATLQGYIMVPPSDLEQVKRELVNHKRLTMQEPGCITFNVSENSDNPLRFDGMKSLSIRRRLSITSDELRRPTGEKSRSM